MGKNNRDTSPANSLAEVSHHDLPAELKGFVEEQISFPPYWTPELNKSFYGMVIDVDSPTHSGCSRPRDEFRRGNFLAS